MKTLLDNRFGIIVKALIAFCLTTAFAFGASAAEEALDRGEAAENRGDLQEAIKQYAQAIKIDPNYALAYVFRGNAYDKLGDYKSATKDARKACELGDCKALKYLGQNKLLRD
jgi:tetratricopeptide (TPR) repeat protein